MADPPAVRELQFDQIRQIARGTDDIIVVSPKIQLSMHDLGELLEDLRSIDQRNRWLVLPFGVRIEHLSDERLKRLGLQRTSTSAGRIGPRA